MIPPRYRFTLGGLFWWVLVFCLFCAGVVAGWPLLALPVIVPAWSAAHSYQRKSFCDSHWASGLIGSGYGAVAGLFLFWIGFALTQAFHHDERSFDMLLAAAPVAYGLVLPAVTVGTVIGHGLASWGSQEGKPARGPHTATASDDSAPDSQHWRRSGA